ncbi:hypothetical protein [Rhizobium laguerreae]|uniref:hypothetical protein n=1 Tax=Rhizobium laguerreae TaxID=1076926 RepID=UPI001C8FAB45|nr:hypothetical protein [Rhizobium laguerreae]MBY3347970.1 hypothetical protein [Rhizobium laguerreae]MBY3354933.1 hypothetical protein [Rhizobium laguerreae]MBY3376238.1 hypothetical protein [Rhizobium laguerreae]MBY3431237.1 hypothetical protein [Rhizobium laguerreae]MBY3439853.1 hypothetical protein [Rhizobium laguerreae]
MRNFSELLSRRQRLKAALQELKAARNDVSKFGAEGDTAVVMVMMWASVMMVTDVLKIGMSAADKRALSLFSAIDNGIAKADGLLQIFGARPMVKKADLLKQVDPNLQKSVVVIDYLRKGRDVLDKAAKQVELSRDALENYKALNLVAKLGLAMADDTILLMQAGTLQTQNAARIRNVIAAIDRQVSDMDRKVAEIDREIDFMLQQNDRLSGIG